MMLFSRDIFPGKDLVFIAEIGLNHNGSIDTARKMISEAYNAGADAVKFQTFIPEMMNSVYTDSLIKYGIEKNPDTKEIDFFKKFILSKNEYNELMLLASRLKMEFFSSPFDNESVDVLEKLGVKFYKIASSEVTNHILINKIAATKKPVIMSTGISNKDEISMAVDLLKKNGTPDIILLHCVSLYPLPMEYANLNRITYLKKTFGLEVGYSDHTRDSKTSEIAAALGAKIFEKHITLNRGVECPDREVSLAPDELKSFIQSVKQVKKALGSGQINFGDSEKEVARLARKSLFAKKTIPKGKILTVDDVVPKRPGVGVPVYKLNSIIGKNSKTEIQEDHIIRMEDFD
jgi:N,N'-diacetyllegionaminate synthase